MIGRMKRLKWIVSICLAIGLTQVRAQSVDDDSPTSREQVSRAIITLRDSLSGTLAELQKNSSEAIEASPQQAKDIQDLIRYKVRLDKSIDEIVNSRTWSMELSEKTIHTIDDVRKEYRRIKGDSKP
jgi:hypothetical protein